MNKVRAKNNAHPEPVITFDETRILIRKQKFLTTLYREAIEIRKNLNNINKNRSTIAYEYLSSEITIVWSRTAAACT